MKKRKDPHPFPMPTVAQENIRVVPVKSQLALVHSRTKAPKMVVRKVH